jgi:hypothetical protein
LTAAQLQAALLHGVAAAPPNYHQTQQLYQVPQTPLQQPLLVAGGYPVAHTGSVTFADANSMQQQQQFVGGNSGSQQQQMQLSALQVDGSSYVLVSSRLTAADSVSSMSCLNSSLSSSNSTASSCMLCSTPSGQTIVLPVASPAVPGVNNGNGNPSLLLQQQQQQVMQQQMVQLQQVPQQQQQAQQLSATGQPLQLSVQPELMTIAGHLSAAAAAGNSHAVELLSDPPGLQQQQQQFLQQQLQDLSMLNAMPPCSIGYNNILQDWQLAGQQQQFMGGSGTPTAAVTVAAGLPMLQSMNAGSFTSAATPAGASGNAMCGPGSMALVQMPGYAASAAAALAPGNSSASDASGARLPPPQQQHQLLGQLSRAVLRDCSSSTGSPMLTAGQMHMSGRAGSGGVPSMMCNRSCVPAPAGLCASASARGLVGSPTSSSCSSGSSGQLLVGVGGGNGVPMF